MVLLHNYIKVNNTAGLFFGAIIRAATALYSAIFEQTREGFVEKVQSGLAYYRQAIRYANSMNGLSRSIPMVKISGDSSNRQFNKMREIQETKKRIRSEIPEWNRLLKHISARTCDYNAFRIMALSMHYYLKSYRWVKGDYYLALRSIERGREIIRKAITLAKKAAAELPRGFMGTRCIQEWKRFVISEERRFDLPNITIYQDSQKSAVQVRLIDNGPVRPRETFVRGLLSFFLQGDPSLKKSREPSVAWPDVTISHSKESLIVRAVQRGNLSGAGERFAVHVLVDPRKSYRGFYLTTIENEQYVLRRAELHHPYGLRFDEEWRGKLERRIKVSKRGTIIELKIPFGFVGIVPKAGDEWGANVLISDNISRDKRAWSAMLGESLVGDPGRFGTVRFG